MRLAFWKERSDPTYPLSFSDWISQWQSQFAYNGHSYPLSLQQTLQGSKQEEPDSYTGLVQSIYQSNGVVFACMLVRLLLFSEARFKFRQQVNGRPGDLFGTQDLAILEQPWVNGTTGDLLARALQDSDLAGNFYAVRERNGLRRLRPDWVAIALSAPASDYRAEVLGYAYYPGGRHSGNEPEVFRPEQVCHFAPIPDPQASYRGMSWLTPVIREVMADSAARDHKLSFFENAATPNLGLKLDLDFKDSQEFEEFVDKMDQKYAGSRNAYKTMYLAGGADPVVIGTNFEQMDFKVVQGAGETRIAAAAGVPPVIVGLSEGLAAATYSNYELAMRRFTDLTMRPLWRNMAASLASIVTVPSGAELWYDDRDIPALAEDQKKAAEIQQIEAATAKSFIDAGFIPDSVISAIQAGDLGRLQHSGLMSVQLLPPGSTSGSSNGNGPPAELPQPQ